MKRLMLFPKLVGLKQRWMKNSMLAVSIVLLIFLVTFSIYTSSYYTSAVRNGLMTKARTATDFFANYITKTYAEYYDSAYKYTETFADGNKLDLQFVDTDGKVLISSYGVTAGTRPGTADITNAITNGEISVWTGRNTLTNEKIMSVSAPMLYSGNQIIGVMRYVTSMAKVDRQIFLNIMMALALCVAVVLIMFFTNLVLIKSVIEPVTGITNIARRIADGSYGIQIDKEYKDEIGDMVKAINEMSYKIAQADKVQTEFVSAVSHELRTPLTAITGWSETLMYDASLDGDAKKGIRIILKEARRLTKMVEELLEFTRIEDGRFTLNIERIDVAVELEDSIYTYRELLHQDDIELVYEPYMYDLPLIDGDPERLRQVFLNLLDNAAKYAKEGKRIDVAINVANRDDEKSVVIMIRDYGPGIPEDELDQVKKKFYKGKNAKERGSGIGLAVCDEIIKYHGGTLDLSNAEGGGLCIMIRLPVKE